MRLLESIRKWIDGVSQLSIPESTPRFPAEEFLVKLSREIDAVMKKEIWRSPEGPTYLPGKFIVFLNSEADKEWRGPKRQALEQTLINILSERARALSGKAPLAVESFAVELRVDGTLKKDEIRVQSVWDDSNPEATVPISSKYLEGGPEETIVHIPTTEIFTIEVWRGKSKIANFPFAKSEITIGRGSQTTAVDLPIKGDPEVSRVHAILKLDDETQSFWLTAKGRNPTLVANQQVRVNKAIQVTTKDKIEISSFTLRIQPMSKKKSVRPSKGVKKKASKHRRISR
jgi:hypothetical protein